MTNNPLISVIVPVYNTEAFLDECLNSLRFQTYKNLEFVCINNASSDCSYDILKEYREKDTRFIIINTNKSDMSARNTGLNLARGEYISFVDSSDRISLNLYQKFVNLKTKPDIYIFNACMYNKNSKHILPRYFFSLNEWQNHEGENTIHSFKEHINLFNDYTTVVNKIYKTDFLKSISKNLPNNKLFLENNSFKEHYVNFLTMILSKSICVNTDPLYYYRIPHFQDLSSHVFDIFVILDMLEILLKNTNNYETYKYAFFQYKYKILTQLLFLADKNLQEAFYIEMQKRLRKCQSEKLDQRVCERLKLYGVYKNILKLNFHDFFEKYNGKII